MSMSVMMAFIRAECQNHVPRMFHKDFNRSPIAPFAAGDFDSAEIWLQSRGSKRRA
ncbi:hypothetical protein [Sphingomonas nostoxanthinifaciens]|uniref:hypothetical protein n=1 Tax=Sphingomonas nostoxanthinifaciens TaxID=2872652 RepID=UPI001CC1FC23|nr:hypothetical protein [Sphingomonas nostoxanthinifaciens]UAK23466.1 hypothetical protein K8P63_13835 [Sphingomonas nostoxanthinifaciens]